MSVQGFSLKEEHWLLVGDILGKITFVKVDPANPLQASIGAFNDNKAHKTKIVLMFMGENNTLYAMSETGLLRRWTF